MPDVHYLFTIFGEGSAVAEIVFPETPVETSRAEIVVCKGQYEIHW
jgi:hypothetical protein